MYIVLTRTPTGFRELEMLPMSMIQAKYLDEMQHDELFLIDMNKFKELCESNVKLDTYNIIVICDFYFKKTLDKVFSYNSLKSLDLKNEKAVKSTR
jgi:hypothetical protein